MRHFSEKQLLIASANQGKVQEIKAMLAPFPIEVVGLDQFNIESPEETGSTFTDNAALKAEYYGSKTHLPALADDSGLAVEALNGAPGVHSARWAGEEVRDYAQAMERIKHEVSESRTGNYNAAFICALALRWPDGHIETVEGKVNGSLMFPPQGDHGFGYDPIFIPDGYNQTFAEMDKEEKDKLSHRAKAFQGLIAACFN